MKVSNDTLKSPEVNNTNSTLEVMTPCSIIRGSAEGASLNPNSPKMSPALKILTPKSGRKVSFPDVTEPSSACGKDGRSPFAASKSACNKENMTQKSPEVCNKNTEAGVATVSKGTQADFNAPVLFGFVYNLAGMFKSALSSSVVQAKPDRDSKFSLASIIERDPTFSTRSQEEDEIKLAAECNDSNYYFDE